MKIRNGFVTNSSSSSYVVINIKSKKLVEVLSPFVEMLEELGYGVEIENDIIRLDGEDMCYETPNYIEEVVGSLQFLDEENEELWNILNENNEEITKDIESVEWINTDYGRGEDELRFDESNYPKEYLKSIYKKIAKEKNCDVSDVRYGDFCDYVICESSARINTFTYDKTNKIEKRSYDFELI